MVEAEPALLHSAAEEIGIGLSDAQASQLIGYVDLMEKWNRAFNLTAVRRRTELFSRHILESLAIKPYICGEKWADIGTGAGLPGVPLAITEPNKQFVLLDSNGKKTRFLLEVKRALGLSNIEVETSRVENWQPAHTPDAVITRAFANLATTIGRTEHLLHDHGKLFAMKTESEAEEIDALPSGFELIALQDVAVPGRAWQFQLLSIQRTKR
jgi:16S rRNA (guanine527-N7)-methyltransferase